MQSQTTQALFKIQHELSQDIRLALRQQLLQGMSEKEAQFKDFERSLTYLHSIGSIRRPWRYEDDPSELPCPIDEVSVDSGSPRIRIKEELYDDDSSSFSSSSSSFESDSYGFKTTARKDSAKLTNWTQMPRRDEIEPCLSPL